MHFARCAIVRICIFTTTLLLLGCHRTPEYGLPVAVGTSMQEVHRVLGAPTEYFKPKDNDRVTIEWFYTRGIIATFDGDLLSVIQVPNGQLVDYKGFLPYSNGIVRGLKLTDSKQKILATLGTPTKIESDSLPSGTKPDVPVVWPNESQYYWRLDGCTVEVDFLNQAQNVSDQQKLTLPKDSVTQYLVRK